MSLWRYRRTIAQAVAGELSPAREMALRAHLAGCADCRGHYDQLARVAAVLSPEIGARRELARLSAALGPAPAPRPRTQLRWLRWTPLVLAPAAALLLWIRPVRHPLPSDTMGDGRPPVGDVTWRGGNETQALSLGLLVYASRRVEGGVAPVRLVADLPGSGEGQLHHDDYVQFSVRGLRAASYVTVVGLDEAGEVHVYAPRPDAPPRPLAPEAGNKSLGPSVDLSVKHRPGRLRLFALASGAPVDAGVMAAAARRAGFSGTLALPGQQASGLLAITP